MVTKKVKTGKLAEISTSRASKACTSKYNFVVLACQASSKVSYTKDTNKEKLFKKNKYIAKVLKFFIK